jgi:hypothetical protein
MALHENQAGMGVDEALGLGKRIGRRRLLQTALWLVGATATGVPLQALAEKVAESIAAGKRHFDPARYAILDAVAETIMPRTDTPGARDAGVPKMLDAMMISWASEARRTAFGEILDEIDRSARSQQGQGFAALTADQQLAVMAAYDQAKFVDPQYRAFKELILTLYYMSEPGATQELRYEHTPGVWIPSLKVTADTRAWAVDLGFSEF